ncbi:hypothetical protein [Actinoplanes sp. ATCC 53533]|uniref:hypothetical protein n=1 Tax=Actinoplanes sp. ATCC 53533 TaxID=1288362 RepID=UPI001F1ED7A4|nr:hypothetical protein [Actinoplanes sp. ATCC 53533]
MRDKPQDLDEQVLIGAGEIDDEEVLARYAEAGGHTVTPAGIALHRQWWALADVAVYVDDLRRPHGDGEDAAAALTYLTGYLAAR